MPKKLHDKLEREYRKKGLRGDKLDRAVYGTMTNIEKGRAPGKKRGK